MTSQQFKEIKESNPWNPFDPTKRDIERTEQLAKKNPVVTALLTLLFTPAGMIYLNRGVNSLKIWLYAIAIAVVFGIVMEVPEDKAFATGQKIGLVGNIFMIVENVRTITRAKKRQQSS